MQIDFHHAVTYVLSRLAGFSHEDSRVISYAAQYVDDSVNKGTIRFDNGQTYDHIASSHKTFDVANNIMNTEDYSVWVPFHFLPGNNGAIAGQAQDIPPVQRLLCQPDSPLAVAMLDACKARKGSRNGLHRLGITTHVFADTFAHQRFAGIRHDVNKANAIEIHSITVEEMKLKGLANVVSLTEINLGHGSVATFPDLPFLQWTYNDNYGKPFPRKNHQIFMDACEKIFQFYSIYLGKDPSSSLNPQDHELISGSLFEFSETDGSAREARWMELLGKGGFTFGPLTSRELADIQYAEKGEGSWKWKALGTPDPLDTPDRVFSYTPVFEVSDWRLFHEALKEHRTLVLEQLIPSFGIPSLDALTH